MKENDGAERGEHKSTEIAVPALLSESVRKDYSSAPTAEVGAKELAEVVENAILVYHLSFFDLS